MNVLPVNRFQQVQWKEVFVRENIGQVFRIELRQINSAMTAAKKNGYVIDVLRDRDPLVFRLVRAVKVPRRRNWKSKPNPEAGPERSIDDRIREAWERKVEYTEKRAMEDDPEMRNRFGALARIWEIELAALMNRKKKTA